MTGLRTRWIRAGEARPANYLFLVATVTVLIIVGVVMVLSASSVESMTNYGSAWYFWQRQLVWTVLGVAAFIVVSRIDYHLWRRAVVPLLAVSAVLLVVVLIPSVGIEAFGARRWLGVGWLRFQPVEIAKIAMLVYAAHVLTRRANELDDWRRSLRPILVVLLALAVLVLAQPDMDSTIVLALIVSAVFIVGGVRIRHLASLAVPAVAFAALVAVAAPYRRARVSTFLDPWQDPSNTGYQLSQSLIALGSGGWTGVGLGNGRAKWMFLPNAHTDFIFAIIGEELGFLGCILVLVLFVAFAIVGARIAAGAPDRFGMLVAAGVTVWVVGQALINIGAVTGLLPVSGITLPFVSFGGSALFFTLAATGLLANVARQGR
jgi:cell division protein FtsW